MFLGSPYMTLLPVFALDVLDSGSQGLGLLGGSNGLGALVGSLVVAAMSASSRRGALQMAAGVVCGVMLLVFAFAGALPLACASLVIVGLCSAAYRSLNSTMVMSITPPGLYGRVMSVYMMTFALMPLASIPAGALADRIGPQITVGGAGALLVVSVLAIMQFRPRTAQPGRLHPRAGLDAEQG
jgi:predicted MFS family arabinose efflux permease